MSKHQVPYSFNLGFGQRWKREHQTQDMNCSSPTINVCELIGERNPMHLYKGVLGLGLIIAYMKNGEIVRENALSFLFEW